MTIKQTISPDSLCISRILPFYGCHRDDGLFTFGEGMRICTKCGVMKERNEFGRHKTGSGGMNPHCKSCVAKYQKAYRLKNRESLLASKRAYTRTQAGKDVHARGIAKYEDKYPQKVHAKTCVSNAKRDGKLTKEPCQECGSLCRIQAHHADYDRPLDVIWLCESCHKSLHQRQHSMGVWEL